MNPRRFHMSVTTDHGGRIVESFTALQDLCSTLALIAASAGCTRDSVSRTVNIARSQLRANGPGDERRFHYVSATFRLIAWRTR